MLQDELKLVLKLTGAKESQIAFSDEGFLSRGYVVDHGRIVFKFPKSFDVSYENEIRILNYVNTLDLAVNLQKAGWKSEDDSYLGLYGIAGNSLEQLQMTEHQKREAGKQLGEFLKILHTAEPENAPALHLSEEIHAWQERFAVSKGILEKHFNRDELECMEKFVMKQAPEALRTLGEKLVFSHGDLGERNIYIDDGGKVGVSTLTNRGCWRKLRILWISRMTASVKKCCKVMVRMRFCGRK